MTVKVEYIYTMQKMFEALKDIVKIVVASFYFMV
jgi:hypothetical protein